MKSRSTTLCSLAVALAACKGSPAQPPDAPAVADAPMADAPMIDAAVADAAPIDAQPDAPADAGIDANYAFDARADAQLDPVLSGIFAEVDGARIVTSLREMSGDLPVLVNGATITIDQRYDDAGRKRFRDYWTQQMRGLGLEVNALDYQATDHPRPGNNLEAVLPGASPDSFVVIVHYDSMGPPGAETSNPGADDDMTGMAIELETARILAAHKDKLQHTVRFVASDEEELGGLAGARAYAAYIKAKSMTDGFALIGAIDDEQTGWNCKTDGLCGGGTIKWPVFDLFSCDGSQYNYKAFGDQFAQVVADYSTLTVQRGCMGQNSDHYAMWEIGVPTLVYSEHAPFDNPHFDQKGGDTFAKIDTNYLVQIARPAITFQAKVVGISP